MLELKDGWALIYDRKGYEGVPYRADPVVGWKIISYGENKCCGCSSSAMYYMIGQGDTPEQAIAQALAWVPDEDDD